MFKHSSFYSDQPYGWNNWMLWLYLKAFDKNGDGKLSKAEVKVACKKIMGSITDEEIEQLFNKYDFTGDGMVRILFTIFICIKFVAAVFHVPFMRADRLRRVPEDARPVE